MRGRARTGSIRPSAWQGRAAPGIMMARSRAPRTARLGGIAPSLGMQAARGMNGADADTCWGQRVGAALRDAFFGRRRLAFSRGRNPGRRPAPGSRRIGARPFPRAAAVALCRARPAPRCSDGPATSGTSVRRCGRSRWRGHRGPRRQGPEAGTGLPQARGVALEGRHGHPESARCRACRARPATGVPAMPVSARAFAAWSRHRVRCTPSVGFALSLLSVSGCP